MILINMFLPNKYKYILIYMSIQFKNQSRLYIQHQFLPTLFVFLLVKIYLYITTIYVEDYCYTYVVEEVHHIQDSRVKCISSGPHFLIWPQSTENGEYELQLWWKNIILYFKVILKYFNLYSKRVLFFKGLNVYFKIY